MELINKIVALKTERDKDINLEIKDVNSKSEIKDENSNLEIKDVNSKSEIKDENSNLEIKDENSNLEVKDKNPNLEVKDKNQPEFNKIINTEKLSVLSNRIKGETQPPLNGKYITTLEELMTDPEIVKVITMMSPIKRKNFLKVEERLSKSKIIIRPIIDSKWSMLDVAMKATPLGWKDLFNDALPELIELNNILVNKELSGETFYPEKKNLFKAFDMCSLSKIKVVIIGQDPYYTAYNGEPIAQGASFSVHPKTPIPKSLENIYKELERSVPGFRRPNHGDLTEWMIQGVFLLNTCLTVKPGFPKSHGNIWIGFINKVLKAICAVNPKCIYMLWGREAEKIETMLTGRPIILTGPHPSGFSAHFGFIGCNHFVKANNELKLQGKSEINWNII